jgi:hypothetical protein
LYVHEITILFWGAAGLEVGDEEAILFDIYVNVME